MSTRVVLPVWQGAASSGATYVQVDSLRILAAELKQLLNARGERLGVVVITLTFAGQRSPALVERRAQATCRLLAALRSLVRRTDRVFVLGNRGYVVLPDCDEPGRMAVEERLWWALCSRVRSLQTRELADLTALAVGGRMLERADSQNLLSVLREAARPRRVLNAPLGLAEPVADSEADSEGKPGQERGPGPTQELAQALPPKQDQRLVPGVQLSLSSAPGEELLAEARRLGIPYLAPLPRRVSASVRQAISPHLAHELHCCPIGRARKTLTVALADSRNHRAILERLERETGLQIFPVLTPAHELQQALERLSTTSSSHKRR
ncbi:MAG: hypothetical protein IRZ31_10445 [Thermogemmatispora sp.]|uniref:Type II secretion system protein GspE N-terminal domain-containing protein n=1 Tax=Thermogemmatispora tikiterensis TaxID=1825093 RepID=A0A328VQ52_9CHLR|nr:MULTISPECIES: hypothetical protein [Thermogemmatispora]MBX5457310.1 hypothetical protein [Thermogemmatispora sp.]RAQ97860.1 hypothetical protein A4R35_20135 [Thermogemmatispora tikiterensis]